MAQSSLECANIALTKMGAPQITALSDTDERAKAANLCLDPLKKSLLRSHPWNFALKRTTLEPTLIAITNITADGATGWFKVFTGSTTGLSNGDRVTIEEVVGCEAANGTWEVDAVVAGTSFLLEDQDFSGEYDTDGTWTQAGNYGYSYSIALPSDCIRVLRVHETDGTDYRIEAGRVLTDDHPVELKYVYDVTDYTTMDTAFYDLLSTALALEISYRVTQSSTLIEQLRDMLRRQMAHVRFLDATEDPAEELGANDWIKSRFNYNAGWPRNIA